MIMGDHRFVAADIPAGLGYLAGGLAALAAEIALIRYRHRFARGSIDQWVSSARATPPRWRWTHGTWAKKEWDDERVRENALIWIWLPPALFLALIVLVMVASAVAEFRR